MKASTLSIKQTGIFWAENLVTLVTFLVLNAIFIIPISQLVARIFNVAHD